MNLIASVLELDRTAVKALRITDPYSLHRVVYSLYPDMREQEAKSSSVPSGILWADRGGDFRSRQILLLADREPAKQVDDRHGEIRSRLIPTDFLAHDHYRFKVIVNPTRRDSASKKLMPVKGREAVAEWFIERAEASWGFAVSVAHLQIDRLEVLQFKDKAQRPVTLAQAHVQGQLRVTDHAQFQKSFAQGIGRGRAFGCGLLQIVPVLDSLFA